MQIEILGRPIPAVRMTGRGKYVKGNAQKYLNYKEQIAWTARMVVKSPSKSKMVVGVRVYLWGVEDMGMDGDVDNYLKSALDGCNKIIWLDDRQVVDAHVTKFKCQKQEERMEIEFREWEDEQ